MRAVNVARSPVIVHPDVASFRPTHVLQRFPERRNAGLSLRIALGKAHQYTDPPHPVRLLRARRERPRRRGAGEQRYDLATVHDYLVGESEPLLAESRDGALWRSWTLGPLDRSLDLCRRKWDRTQSCAGSVKNGIRDSRGDNRRRRLAGTPWLL